VNKLAYFDLDTYKLSTLIPFWGLAPKKNRSRFPEKEGPMVGDIVVFTKESDLSGKSFVKRIIGVPGDQISIIDGITYLNGDVLRESYLVSVNAYQNQEYNPLNSEEFFVMGDNRIASSDSRHWGPIGIDSVIGKVFADYALPFKIGFLEETE
jgi:signal peptidase I